MPAAPMTTNPPKTVKERMLAICDVLSNLRTVSPFRNANQTENAPTPAIRGMDTMRAMKNPIWSQPLAFQHRNPRDPETMNGTTAKISARYLIHSHMLLSASMAGANCIADPRDANSGKIMPGSRTTNAESPAAANGVETNFQASNHDEHARPPNSACPACAAPGFTGQQLFPTIVCCCTFRG
jgi:hypothetical protein